MVNLTERQLDILRLISQGASYWYVARVSITLKSLRTRGLIERKTIISDYSITDAGRQVLKAYG